jgi:alpha-glucosidase
MKMSPLQCAAFWVVGLAGSLLLPISLPAAIEVGVVSPDRAVQFRAFSERGRLMYTLAFGEQRVIEPSPLAMVVDGVNLGEGIELEEVRRQSVQESFPWRGVHAWATNHYETATIPVRHARSNARYTLEVRAFNDGAAWRCRIPGSSRPRVPDEATSFVVPAGSTVWYHGLGGHYEDVHRRRMAAEIPAGDWAAPPLTFRLAGGTGYGCITEAALVNYSGMALQADGQGGFKLMLGHQHPISYPFRLRYSNDVERVSQPAAISGEILTPWRVVMVGRDLNALVNCDIVPSLCPPPDPRLFPEGIQSPWIKPGRAVWKYLDGGQNTFEEMKTFSRLAGELGFEYHVIEGFWSRWSEGQIRELVDYSRQRGVGLWFWKHSRELRTAEARAEFFRKLREWGVVGAKIDFFDHEHREVINLYHALLEEAARHGIMVNFHGANKPTGEARTWPNELVREGVRGMESSRLKERAQHDVTLPFTRFLAGPADYTPVHFGSRRGDTTWTHQIASAAVFTAPLLTYAAHPATLLTNAGVEMIKSIPATWDETRVLEPSDLGEIAVFARRRGAEWFLAILNGPEARALEVPLSFLGETPCRVLLIRDRPEDPASMQVEKTTAKRGDRLPVKLSAGGGFIARFVPEETR